MTQPTHRIDLVEFDRALAETLRLIVAREVELDGRYEDGQRPPGYEPMPEERRQQLRDRAAALDESPPHAGDYVEITREETFGSILDARVANEAGRRGDARLARLVASIVRMRLDGRDVAEVTPAWLRAQGEVVDYVYEELDRHYREARFFGPFGGATETPST